MKSWPPPFSHQRPPVVALHYWGRRGGGSQFTRFLAQLLVGDGTEVILSLARGNAEMEAFQASGLPIVEFNRPTLSTLWRDGWLLARELKTHADTLASLNVDAVVITMNSPFAWPFIRALQRRRIPVLYIAHDAEPHPGDYAGTWQRVTQDLLLKRADRIVALSQSVAKRLGDRIPICEDKISVIPLETVFRSRRERPLDPPLPGEPLRLLSYGRLLPYKGFDLLAQALQPLRANPGWRLTIAGSGPLEAKIRIMFANWPQVHLELDWISEERSAELFSSHHLLICPYVEASQSGAVAHALSWAMPSLVMPAGALPGQVGFGTAGLIGDLIDADSFRCCLQSLLENPTLLTDLSCGAVKLLADHRTNQNWTALVRAYTNP